MDEIDTRPEAVEALARRLHTRQPYKHPLQIAADLHVGPKDELLGDFLLILGQGDYPTLRQLADQTRELQDQAAATLRALSARSPAPAGAETWPNLPTDALIRQSRYVADHFDDWQGSSYIGDTIRALCDRLAAPAGAEGWAVRPLIWEEDHDTWGEAGTAYCAKDPWGEHYRVHVEGAVWFAEHDNLIPSGDIEQPTKEAAFAVCQADYETRIGTCLVPAPADAARETALLAALARIEGYALGLVGSEDRDAPWAVRKMLDYIEEQRRALAAPLPTEARDGE